MSAAVLSLPTAARLPVVQGRGPRGGYPGVVVRITEAKLRRARRARLEADIAAKVRALEACQEMAICVQQQIAKAKGLIARDRAALCRAGRP